jgi:hypothetical protein
MQLRQRFDFDQMTDKEKNRHIKIEVTNGLSLFQVIISIYENNIEIYYFRNAISES